MSDHPLEWSQDGPSYQPEDPKLEAGLKELDSRGATAGEGNLVDEHEQQDLKRGLGQRHVSMIALAGTSST